MTGHDINELVEAARERSCPMLGYVDEYGDTRFNVVQMQLLIPELESLESAGSEAVRATAAALLKLARQVPLRPHRYLLFLGD
ncbi:hypothetical protein F4558_004441 [Micromonospora profundi]|uniref:hypothetical protein n=1 Tax=Micromonospora profundi TaxID=1420889 RepID=UPI001439454F|nr:hypothetical protein [Micromonospora profundi]NJC14615.1 hypothetical protein [Micromonospora profundi]